MLCIQRPLPFCRYFFFLKSDFLGDSPRPNFRSWKVSAVVISLDCIVQTIAFWECVSGMQNVSRETYTCGKRPTKVSAIVIFLYFLLQTIAFWECVSIMQNVSRETYTCGKRPTKVSAMLFLCILLYKSLPFGEFVLHNWFWRMPTPQLKFMNVSIRRI